MTVEQKTEVKGTKGEGRPGQLQLEIRTWTECVVHSRAGNLKETQKRRPRLLHLKVVMKLCGGVLLAVPLAPVGCTCQVAATPLSLLLPSLFPGVLDPSAALAAQ